MLQSLEATKSYSQQQAYVMVNCEDGSEQFVLEELKFIDGVREIASTVGSYDIVAKIEAKSTEILREVIIMKIRKIPHVRATTTIVCGQPSLYS